MVNLNDVDNDDDDDDENIENGGCKTLSKHKTNHQAEIDMENAKNEKNFFAEQFEHEENLFNVTLHQFQ